MIHWADDLPDKMMASNTRNRTLSLDKLVDWPAQLGLVGEFAGKEILDVGCGLADKSELCCFERSDDDRSQYCRWNPWNERAPQDQ
jgi:hypothetical protein